MVTPEGAAEVIDLGIARSLADPATAITRTGTILGTARYLAPEQLRQVGPDSCGRRALLSLHGDVGVDLGVFHRREGAGGGARLRP